MDRRWIEPVRTGGLLPLRIGDGMESAWVEVVAASVAELNALLAARNIALRFEAVTEGTPHLRVATTAGAISSDAGGGVLDPEGRHGLTRTRAVGSASDPDSARIESALIFLPVSPGGRRRRPPRGLMQVMLVHEFLHAAGLLDHNSRMDDIMAGAMEDGAGGKVHPWVGLGQDMPPCVFSSGTVTRLVDLWGQRATP